MISKAMLPQNLDPTSPSPLPFPPQLPPSPSLVTPQTEKSTLQTNTKAWACHLPQAMLLQHYNVQSMMQDGEGSSLDLLLISLQINSDKNLMTKISENSLCLKKKK